MSFGLRRGRVLDPGEVAAPSLSPLPDRPDPLAARVDVRSWFPDPSRPLEIEIGSGKGTFLVEQGASRRGTNFLGIERAREFYEYAADRCRRAALTNVRMLCANAAEFLRWRCPDAVASVVHLYFPDPWPKTRHHKRRIVTDRFLEDVARVLVPGGVFRVVTDHDGYWSWMEERFARVRGLLEPIPWEDAGERGELAGTNFERKYRREGRPFHVAAFQRTRQALGGGGGPAGPT